MAPLYKKFSRTFTRAGNRVISDYHSGDQITFTTEYTDAYFDTSGNFHALSSTGALVIKDATGKLINICDSDSNPYLKAYAATTSEIIDGRDFDGFEIIDGSPDSDTIYAGDDGSRLWGGLGDVADTLFGGDGDDIFVTGQSQGADSLQNVSSADIVRINDAALSDIISTTENNGTISVNFSDSSISVQCSENLSPKFILADSSTHQYNRETKAWQSA